MRGSGNSHRQPKRKEEGAGSPHTHSSQANPLPKADIRPRRSTWLQDSSQPPDKIISSQNQASGSHPDYALPQPCGPGMRASGGHRARFGCLFLRLHPPASANLRPGEEAHSARLQDPASSPGRPRPPAVTLEAAPGHRWTLRTVKTPGSSSAAETPGYELWS